MNYLLLFIILVLGGGGYYEYTTLQQKQAESAVADQKQISDLNGQIAQLQADKKKLQDDAALTDKNFSGVKAQVVDLTTQLQAMQKALDDAKKAAAAVAQQNEVKPPPVTTNALGTIVTLDGKTFQNCQLLKVDAEGITVNHSEGITKLAFLILPIELEHRFGFDSHKEAQLTPDEVQVQEGLRIKADLPSAK